MKTKDKFIKYADLLRVWSGRMNLVAPSTLTDIETRHLADSAQLADILPTGVDVADLGSGAGFPGVVLAIMGWNVTCIESIGKKAQFLMAAKSELDLANLTIFHGRVEDFIKSIKKAGKHREKELVFTARAFASLTKILDYVGHTKYRLFLLKGREVQTEINDALKHYRFEYDLIPSRTGDGFVVMIKNIK